MALLRALIKARVNISVERQRSLFIRFRVRRLRSRFILRCYSRFQPESCTAFSFVYKKKESLVLPFVYLAPPPFVYTFDESIHIILAQVISTTTALELVGSTPWVQLGTTYAFAFYFSITPRKSGYVRINDCNARTCSFVPPNNGETFHLQLIPLVARHVPDINWKAQI